MENIAAGERVRILRALFPFLDLTNLSGNPTQQQLEAALLSGLGVAAITTDEFVNPPAASAAAILAAFATVNGEQVINSGFLAPGLAELAARPRNFTFTTGGATAAHAPSSVLITGTDINGNVLTETKALSQVGGIDVGVKAFAGPVSFDFTGGTGTDATISIGYGTKFGLKRPIKSRAGLAAAIREVAAGALVTNGTIVLPATAGPNGTYSPNTAPDGTKTYALTYEYVVP